MEADSLMTASAVAAASAVVDAMEQDAPPQVPTAAAAAAEEAPREKYVQTKEFIAHREQIASEFDATEPEYAAVIREACDPDELLHAVNFPQLREITARNREDQYPEFAARIRAAKTPNQLLAALNTLPVQDYTDYMAKQGDDVTTNTNYDEDNPNVKELAAKAVARCTFTDPETGEKVVADLKNPKHREALKAARIKEAEEALTKGAESDQALMKRNFARYMKEFEEATSTLLLEQGMGKMQIEGPKPTHNEGEDSRPDATAPTQNAVSMQATEKASLGVIYSDPREMAEFTNHPSKTPFAKQTEGMLPLSLAKISEILKANFVNARRAQCSSYVFPTIGFESYLRALLYGTKMSRTTTTYSYERFMHSLFIHLINTDIRPTHEKLLHAQEEGSKEAAKYLRIESASVAADDAEGRARVDRMLQDNEFLAKSIQVAKHAYYNEGGKIVSPFVEYLTRSAEMGGAWKPYDIPFHSVEEIKDVVRTVQRAVVDNFNRGLKLVEEQYRENKIGIRTFLDTYWTINHAAAVESARYFEIGILMIFECQIPQIYRPSYVMQTNKVPIGGFVDESTAYELCVERSLCMTVRREALNMITRGKGEDAMGYDGVRFSLKEQVSFDMNERVDKKTAMSPTYSELYEFYRMITMKHPNVESMQMYVEAMNILCDRIYEKGKLRENYGQIIDEISNSFEEYDSLKKQVHKRIKQVDSK